LYINSNSINFKEIKEIFELNSDKALTKDIFVVTFNLSAQLRALRKLKIK